MRNKRKKRKDKLARKHLANPSAHKMIKSPIEAKEVEREHTT